MQDIPYIHLRTHSACSLTKGLSSPEGLIQSAWQTGMSHLALSDLMSVAGAVKFCIAAHEHQITPLVGAELRIRATDSAETPFQLTLLCMNPGGWENLCALLSGNEQAARFSPVDCDQLAAHSEGLIILSGAMDGDIGQAIMAGDIDRAATRASAWKSVFGDRFYLEVQRVGRVHENKHNTCVVDLAQRLEIPLVATNPVCFLHEDHSATHALRVSLSDWRSTDAQIHTPRHHFVSAVEMKGVFADLPEAIANTRAIAQRCSFDLAAHLHAISLRDETVPPELAHRLREKASTALLAWLDEQHNESSIKPLDAQTYRDRLNAELDWIATHRLTHQFWMAAEIADWATATHRYIGGGGGFLCCSLVAFVTGITRIDPIAFNLPFDALPAAVENELPVFIMLVGTADRDKLIQHLQNHYGARDLLGISQHRLPKIKELARKLGRALAADEITLARLDEALSNTSPHSLQADMTRSPTLRELQENNPQAREILETIHELAQLPTDIQDSATSVLLIPNFESGMVPVRPSSKGMAAVPFDRSDLRKLGWFTCSICEIRLVSRIDRAIQIRQAQTDTNRAAIFPKLTVSPDMKLPYPFDALTRNPMTHYFKSRCLNRLCKQMPPRVFNDLVSLFALAMPRAVKCGLTRTFQHNRTHPECIVYAHPCLQSVLEPTHGVFLFHEQIVEAARLIAGMSPKEALTLCRVVTHPEESDLDIARAYFTAQAYLNGVSEVLAEQIFEQMETEGIGSSHRAWATLMAMLEHHMAWLSAADNPLQ